MLSVALTGNIAAGKSAVAALFRQWGATLIDADAIVREVQEPGGPVVARIAEVFGPEVVRPDGSLDRPLLRRLVLDDAEARTALERIVHPAVQARRQELLRDAAARGDRIVVSDIPLLFEAADPAAFDAVVLVDAPEPLRLARLTTQRGLGVEEARRMIAAQMPAREKRARSLCDRQRRRFRGIGTRGRIGVARASLPRLTSTATPPILPPATTGRSPPCPMFRTI
jgi:dephospho-CoA kinase